MKKGKYILLILMIIIGLKSGYGQQLGFSLPEGTNKVRIPFEFQNNLIVLPVVLNNGVSLKFILDTGVQYPILTERYFGELLGLEYSRRIVVQGPGQNDSLTALVCTDIELKLQGNVKSGVTQAILVLEKDYLKLRENLGEEVYGIIGYDIFSRFVVEIDYDDKYLTLHDPKSFKARRNYSKIDLQVHNTKPYINISMKNQLGDTVDMLFMIDTGASHTLLMNNYKHKNIIPSTTIPSVIGRGIGGEIEGLLGRTEIVKIGDYYLEEPILSFPLEGNYGNTLASGSRNGTIGSEFLSRFNVVFDYFDGAFYFKRGTKFSKPFEYDMSGLIISLDQVTYEKIKVNSVRFNSPAYLSGIKKGDIILSINGLSLEEMHLGDANGILRQKEGKKITVKIQRGEQQFKTSFRLQRYI